MIPLAPRPNRLRSPLVWAVLLLGLGRSRTDETGRRMRLAGTTLAIVWAAAVGVSLLIVTACVLVFLFLALH